MSIAKCLRAMHIKNFVLVPAISLLCLSCVAIGCDKKAATNSNFEDGLNHYFEANRECLINNFFPETAGDDKGLDSLVAVGLLSKGPSPKSPGYFVYDLTPSGKKNAEGPTGVGGGVGKAACFATKQVAEILNFTEPSENSLGGAGKVSVVTYTWKLKDIAPWASDPAVAAYFKGNLDELNVPPDAPSRKSQETMILTHQGWRTAQDQ